MAAHQKFLDLDLQYQKLSRAQGCLTSLAVQFSLLTQIHISNFKAHIWLILVVILVHQWLKHLEHHLLSAVILSLLICFESSVPRLYVVMHQLQTCGRIFQWTESYTGPTAGLQFGTQVCCCKVDQRFDGCRSDKQPQFLILK